MPLDPRPVMEGTGYRASVAGRTMLCVQWSTETASGGLDDVRLRVIPWAKEAKCAAFLHCDAVAHEGLLEQAVALVEAAGLVAIRGAHAVEDAASFEAQLRHFASLGPKLGITRNFRMGWDGANGYRKDPAKFAECMHTADKLRREFGSRIVVDWFFGWHDAGSVNQSPEMRAYAEAVMRLTPTPKHLPGEQPDPVDCVVSAWGEWGLWTLVINEPHIEVRFRTRKVLRPAQHGGAECPVLRETERREVVLPKPPYRPGRGGGKQEEKPSIFSRKQ